MTHTSVKRKILMVSFVNRFADKPEVIEFVIKKKMQRYCPKGYLPTGLRRGWHMNDFIKNRFTISIEFSPIEIKLEARLN